MSIYLPSTSPVTEVVQGPPPPGGMFDFIVTVLMENNGFSSVIGPAPYITSFANANALLTNYNKTSSPSEGNYVSMIAGATYGFTGDCGYCPNRSNADTNCPADTRRRIVSVSSSEPLLRRASILEYEQASPACA